MRDQQNDMLDKLREVERQARELADQQPLGIARHRARQIAILAAHVALTIEMARNGRAQGAANDAGRDQLASTSIATCS